MDKKKKEQAETDEARQVEQAAKEMEPEAQTEARIEGVEEESDTAGEENTTDEAAAKLQQLAEQLAAMQEKYMRTYAEYENYRKRTSLQMVDLQLNGHKDMAKAILPVIDDFERALAAMPADDAAREGVKLIYDKMLSILQQKGVKQMTTIGEPFDAELHEAVTQIPATDPGQKNKIIDEVQKGYTLNDKILRYAKVVVAK
jgi:molecular chaperone GrpE